MSKQMMFPFPDNLMNETGDFISTGSIDGSNSSESGWNDPHYQPEVRKILLHSFDVGEIAVNNLKSFPANCEGVCD